MMYEVGYDVGDGIYSVNMVDGGDTLTKLMAEAYAKKHGYSVAYITQLADWEVAERKAKGMPILDAFDEYFEKT